MLKPRLLIEDKFVVRSADNSKFENISRISGTTIAYDANLTVDVNTNIYPIDVNMNANFAVYDVGVDTREDSPNESLQSIMNDWDYVMYGKIFKDEEGGSSNRTVYISFGGLLCSIDADKTIVSEFVLNKRVYLMIRITPT